MEHSKKDFSELKQSKACEDKINENLNNENIRDKTLSGNLIREYCDEVNLREFL